MRIRILLPLLVLLASCATQTRPVAPGGMEYAQWFNLQENQAVILSPYGGAPDTSKVDAPVRSIVCMSSSYIGFLDALGCDSVATGVSTLIVSGAPPYGDTMMALFSCRSNHCAYSIPPLSADGRVVRQDTTCHVNKKKAAQRSATVNAARKNANMGEKAAASTPGRRWIEVFL